MNANISKISHFLILQTDTHHQYQRSKVTKDESQSNSQISKNSMQYKSRSKSTKYLSHANSDDRIYEVINKCKLVLRQICQFNFDAIQSGSDQFAHLSQWLFKQLKRVDNNNYGSFTNKQIYVLILQIKSDLQIYTLLEFIVKQIIRKGICLQVIIESNKSKIIQQITSISDLRYQIKNLIRFNEQISKICLQCSNFILNIYSCSNYQQQHSQVQIKITELMTQINAYFNRRNQSNDDHTNSQKNSHLNNKIAIVSFLPISCSQNIVKCHNLLKIYMKFENNIKQIIINQKKQLKQIPTQPNICYQNYNNAKKQHHSIKTYRNSKEQNIHGQHCNDEHFYNSRLQLPIKQIKVQNIQDKQSLDDSISSEHKDLSKMRSTANMIAENLHMKWRIQTMERQFEIQAQQFVLKANKKYTDLKQQHSFCLQQNGRLRQQNQQLQRQINAIKHENQVLKQLKSQQFQSRQQNQNMMAALQLKLKQLHRQLQLMNMVNAKLHCEVAHKDAQLSKQLGQNQQEVEQKQKQINQYRCFSEELRSMYQNVENQLTAERNRCLNLEKRCNKYEQTLKQMMELGVVNTNSNFNSQNIHSKQYQCGNFVQEKVKQKGNSTKRSEQAKYKNKGENREKNKSENTSKKSNKYQSKKGDAIISKHKRQITFATG